MVKVEMYRAFDGKIFENREECMAHEENEKRNREKQYKKLEELKQKFDEYCEIGDDCEDCVFAKYCEEAYDVITKEMRRLEGK